MKNHPPPAKHEIDIFEHPIPASPFWHSVLAGQCVKRGIRLADLGKEASQMVVDGKFEVTEVKVRRER